MSNISFQLEKVTVKSKSLAINEQTAGLVAAKVFNDVLEGKHSAIEAMEAFTYMGKVAAELKEQADETGKIKMVDLIRQEIEENADDKKAFETARGSKFVLAEVGTSYSFDNTGDTQLPILNKQLDEIKKKIKAREEFLKKLTTPIKIKEPDLETGEEVEVELFPATKTSTSSYKITLAKS